MAEASEPPRASQLSLPAIGQADAERHEPVVEARRLTPLAREWTTELLGRSFLLSPADLEQVRTCRGPHNRLGFALHLALLRVLRFPLPSLAVVPAPIVHFMSRQLEVDPAVLSEYARRDQTRDDHLAQIRAYLDLRAYAAADGERLLGFVVECALHRDDPGVLLEEAEAWLRHEGILLPAVGTLTRLVGRARVIAEERIHARVTAQLTLRHVEAIERLLEQPHGKRGSVLAWLKEPPRNASAKSIDELVHKLETVQESGLARIDLSGLNRNRVRQLAALGRTYHGTALRRFAEGKRHTILVCLFKELIEELTDDIVAMLDLVIGRIFSSSEQELAAVQAANAQLVHASLLVLRRAVGVLLDDGVPDDQVRRVAFREITETAIRRAYDGAGHVVRPADDRAFDFLDNHYPHLRSFLPKVLAAVPFTGTLTAQPVLQGIELLRELDASGRRKVPADAPLGFVPAAWRKVVAPDGGTIDRHMWELCLAEQIRHGIRSSDLHVVGSRQHRDWITYLHTPQAWDARRDSWFATWHAAVDPDAYLDAMAKRLDTALSRVAATLAENSFAQIVDGRLALSRDDKPDIPASAVTLRAQLVELLPRVKLTDLLIEVDAWVGIREHFTHPNERVAGSWAGRGAHLDACIFAVLLAKGCNLPLTTMAEAADIPYHHLTHTADWYVRGECIRKAIVALVDHHHALPLATAFGSGTTAMSDGIRFGVSARSLDARHNPRYFGTGRGITVYDTTSDQYSHPYVQLIGCNLREAVAVLDGVLHHETELPLYEHVVDTHGYTEILFGLFELESRLFSPRIRDLPDQRLYPIDRRRSYGALDALLRGPTINRTLIRSCWDDMHRVAASLKDGTVTATLLVSKLHALKRKSGVHKGIQELGRLHKTLFVLDYISDEAYRRRIHRTLNKGESLHGLARELFFGQQGMFGERDYEAQLNRATCLSLLINAIVVWNTRYLAAALEHVRATGHVVDDTDLEHLSPLLWEQITLHGSYHFDLNPRNGLRPLRSPSAPGESWVTDWVGER
jgi:TnpA family transposase